MSPPFCVECSPCIWALVSLISLHLSLSLSSSDLESLSHWLCVPVPHVGVWCLGEAPLMFLEWMNERMNDVAFCEEETYPVQCPANSECSMNIYWMFLYETKTTGFFEVSYVFWISFIFWIALQGWNLDICIFTELPQVNLMSSKGCKPLEWQLESDENKNRIKDTRMVTVWSVYPLWSQQCVCTLRKTEWKSLDMLLPVFVGW